MSTVSPIRPQMEASWLRVLEDEFEQPYFQSLKSFLTAEKQSGRHVFPPGPQIFNAFNSVPFDKVKVVILGQDPYHGAGQAHGLSFSVPKGVKPPPSLVNIFKELKSDLGLDTPPHGCLQCWADQGVLLLNAVLTVREGEPASHAGKGWETFTDAVIRKLNEQRENLVFLLWGRYAQEKGAHVDRSRHLVLTSAHPSPFSATRFLGCRHFSKANAYLKSKGLAAVDWKVV